MHFDLKFVFCILNKKDSCILSKISLSDILLLDSSFSQTYSASFLHSSFHMINGIKNISILWSYFQHMFVGSILVSCHRWVLMWWSQTGGELIVKRVYQKFTEMVKKDTQGKIGICKLWAFWKNQCSELELFLEQL